MPSNGNRVKAFVSISRNLSESVSSLQGTIALETNNRTSLSEHQAISYFAYKTVALVALLTTGHALPVPSEWCSAYESGDLLSCTEASSAGKQSDRIRDLSRSLSFKISDRKASNESRGEAFLSISRIRLTSTGAIALKKNNNNNNNNNNKTKK